MEIVYFLNSFLFFFYLLLYSSLLQFISVDAYSLQNEVFIGKQNHSETKTDGNDSTTSNELVHRKVSFKRRGYCYKGVAYAIRSVADLDSHMNELECVFFAGISPTKVPEGSLEGTVIAIFSTELLNPLANILWKGKYISEISCNSTQQLYLGSNKLATLPFAPFIASIGPINLVLSRGEYDDGKNVVLIDYRKSMEDPCGKGAPSSEDTPIYNAFPINHFLDVLRLVGKMADGTCIFLGKTYIRNLDLRRYSTYAYFTLVVKDPGVNIQFRPRQSLPPLEKNFAYAVAGV